jgi:hypothetical protein
MSWTKVTMSAERAIVLIACGLCLGTTAMAEEEAVPDADFLEYLGMWQESDEDWLLLEEIQMTDLDERSDPVPEGEESTEMKDES